jgi:DNA-binding IclR family transcriptional regulator
MANKPGSIASVGRALAVLDLLASEAREFGVTAISERLGLSKPVVSRILAMLAAEEEVVRNPHSGQFSLSLKRPLSAIRFLESLGARARWMPVLQDLVAQTGELVELALFHAGTLSCVAYVEPSHQVLRVTTSLGMPLPLHATAAGKAWLAFAPRSVALPLLLRSGLGALTSRTITSVDRLLEQLDHVRQRGFATVEGEFDEGAAAVAAPVRLGVNGEWLVGSLVVAGPISRSTASRLKEFGLAVMLGAQRLNQTWPATLAGPYLLGIDDHQSESASGVSNAEGAGPAEKSAAQESPPRRRRAPRR